METVSPKLRMNASILIRNAMPMIFLRFARMAHGKTWNPARKTGNASGEHVCRIIMQNVPEQADAQTQDLFRHVNPTDGQIANPVKIMKNVLMVTAYL